MNPFSQETTDRQTILVIDDMPDFLKVLSKQLEHWGYRVLKATTGEKGLEIALAEHPHLILLDILMPQMKGRELCKLLKTDPKTQDIPVIFLTALGMSEHVKVGMGLGAEDYIIKPFRPEDFRERIRVCLLRYARSGSPPK